MSSHRDCLRGLRRATALGAFLFSMTAFADVKVGDAFPSIGVAGMTNLAGAPVPDTAGKVMLIDFWASWCPPCKASFPAMARLHNDYAAKGLLLVAVSIDDKPAAATAFWKKLSPPFLTLLDAEKKLVGQVSVPTMPTSYLVGRDGKVRAVYEGFHGEETDRKLRKDIEALLAEKN